MFRFIHGYTKDMYRGIVEKSLLNPNDGFKITQHFLTPEEKKFNTIASVGSELYTLIKEHPTTFYVDRLHGGTFYQRYEFDKSLLDVYEELLGERFLGLQMHECGVVRMLDWNRINGQLKEEPKPWSEEQIYEAIKKVSHNKQTIHLSCGTAKEYSALTLPESVSEYFSDVSRLMKLRFDENDKHVFTCDSCFMPLYLSFENGMKTAMAECGAQTPRTRMQIAYTRGVMASHGKSWGVYYEPWGGKPFSTCLYRRDKTNEWYIKREDFPFTAEGENGGSSTSLMRRIFYLALFGGADYLSEEWGQSNTFYDSIDFELTPYGKVKKEFQDIAAKLCNVKPYTPVALVLPEEIKILSMHDIEDKSFYLNFKNDISPDLFYNTVSAIQSVFNPARKIADEDTVMTNSCFGNIFDILYPDAETQILERYALIIDFSGNLSGKNVHRFKDIDSMHGIISETEKQFLPFSFEKDKIDYILFENDGRNYCAFFNNSGVEKTLEKGETVFIEASKSIVLRFQNGNMKSILIKNNSDFSCDGSICSFSMKAGDIVALEY